MAVPILQSLVGLILVLLGIDTAGTPPTTRGMQWLYRGIFLFLGLLLISLSWIQYRNEQKRDAAAAVKLQELNSRQKLSVPEPQKIVVKQVPVVPTNQVDYEQKYQKLVIELADDKALNPDVRERMIIARAQLGLTNTPSLPATNPRPTSSPAPAPQFASERLAREKVLPYFDYAIKSLSALAGQEARMNGDQAQVTYGGLPEDISADTKAGKRSRVQVGEIKFQTNLRWDIKVDFVESLRPKYEANLSVTCEGGFLLLHASDQGIETRLDTVRGQSFEHSATSGDALKPNIQDAVSKLIAAEADAVENKK